jgi:hypothetical protein
VERFFGRNWVQTFVNTLRRGSGIQLLRRADLIGSHHTVGATVQFSVVGASGGAIAIPGVPAPFATPTVHKSDVL